MQASNIQRLLSRVTTACLLAGFVVFLAGPQACAMACPAVQQEEAGCCGTLNHSSKSRHLCCEAETPVPASPVLFPGVDPPPAFVPQESNTSKVLPVSLQTFHEPVPSQPRLVLSFAELVLQESLLSHAPPVEVL